jgi:hypothetical protein
MPSAIKNAGGRGIGAAHQSKVFISPFLPTVELFQARWFGLFKLHECCNWRDFYRTSPVVARC